MGSSQSNVIRNGDWEHKLCWTKPTDDKLESTSMHITHQTDDNDDPFKRHSSTLTQSLRNLRRNMSSSNAVSHSSRAAHWQKLSETKNGIELASLPPSDQTSRTEEIII